MPASADRAVPSVTTPRISVRSWDASCAVSGGTSDAGPAGEPPAEGAEEGAAEADPAGAAASPTSRCGVTRAPFAIDAVTVAMPSGVVSTLPCPMRDAACSVAPAATSGTRLVVAATPSAGARVSPRASAAERRSAWLTVPACPMTAVLQLCAKAVVHGICPSALAG